MIHISLYQPGKIDGAPQTAATGSASIHWLKRWRTASIPVGGTLVFTKVYRSAASATESSAGEALLSSAAVQAGSWRDAGAGLLRHPGRRRALSSERVRRFQAWASFRIDMLMRPRH